MKLYNQNKDRIENVKSIKTDGGTLYPNKLSDEQLNSYGYYKVKYESAPNRRYYNAEPNSSVSGSEFVIGYTVTERDIDQVKDSMYKDLKEAFLGYSERPIVDTGLGYNIDGGRADLGNFEIGKEFGFPIIKDAEGVDHPATTVDYDACILAIKTKGVELYQTKWTKEETIKGFTTVAECIAYEAEPYDYTVTQEDVDSDIEGTLVLGDIIVRYKNNVREW